MFSFLLFLSLAWATPKPDWCETMLAKAQQYPESLWLYPFQVKYEVDETPLWSMDVRFERFHITLRLLDHWLEVRQDDTIRYFPRVDYEPRFQDLDISYSSDGNPLLAVYFTPWGMAYWNFRTKEFEY